MKTNTSKKRTMSLFNQGGNLYAAIPNMGEDRLAPLMLAFDASVRGHEIFRAIFGLYEGSQIGDGMVYRPRRKERL